MSNTAATQNRLEKELEEARARNGMRRNKNYDAPHTQRRLKRASVNAANCGICGSRVSGKELHLDHCHYTNQTRGFLCNQCNTGLGMFRDSQKLLMSAIKYLDWYEMLNKNAA